MRLLDRSKRAPRPDTPNIQVQKATMYVFQADERPLKETEALEQAMEKKETGKGAAFGGTTGWGWRELYVLEIPIRCQAGWLKFAFHASNA